MAEKNCIALDLSDGGRVHLQSSWEKSSFSIVVLDGVHAWSRTVTVKEVLTIATSWKIDVGEFMNSARSHLCRQHPTSDYSISADKDAGIVQLSFTIDDLWEGEEGQKTLNFDLRLTRMSDVGAIVREMLDHLLASKAMLEGQLAADAERQKKRAASEPEPSITLSFARPSATPRRPSSVVEPRLLDFTNFSRTEETRSICTLTPTRADSREKVRTDDLAVRKREAYAGFDMPLSPNIMRVLSNLSAAGREDERGLKNTEMRSPARREEQSQRSYMVETKSVSIDFSKSGRNSLFGSKAHEDELPSRRTTTTIFEGAQPEDVAMNWTIPETDKHPENTVNGNGMLEKSSSDAGEPGTLNKLAEGKPKEEEPTCRVTLEDTSDAGLRGKAENPHGQRSNEGRSTEEQQQHKKLESREPVRDEAPEETRSLDSLWPKNIIRSISSKRVKKSLVKDTPECRHSGRKRTAADRDSDFISGRALRSVKREFEDDPSYEAPTSGSEPPRRTGLRRNPKVKHEMEDLEEVYPEEILSQYKKWDPIPIPDGFAGNTVAEILKTMPVAGEGRGRGRGRGRPRGRQQRPVDNSPREVRLRRRLRSRSDHSASEEGHVLDPEDSNVDNVIVPDPDYSNFDKERTEDFILPNQIWAVYDEKDGFPRVWARINKVSRHPKFEASVTWLTPYKPSPEAIRMFEKSGYAVSCGKFEPGSEGVLESINTFSHKMEFEWVDRNVVTIYPKKDQVWALYTTRFLKSASATPSPGAKRPQFRVVHILEDVEPEKMLMFSVLERTRGHRTVYEAKYERGSVSFSCVVLFSHRVPAHQLQGNEGPSAFTLKGSWDVDPAGLPIVEGDL